MSSTVDERYALAKKICRLVAEFQKKLTGGVYFGGVNWNAAVVGGYTDALEDLIVKDVVGGVIGGNTDRIPPELLQELRARVDLLFQENRLLVAELELSGMRWGRSGPS